VWGFFALPREIENFSVYGHTLPTMGSQQSKENIDTNWVIVVDLVDSVKPKTLQCHNCKQWFATEVNLEQHFWCFKKK
jgi:hypothetical protein